MWEEDSLKVSKATKIVAAFLNMYAVWTDGYEDSAAHYWDGMVGLYHRDRSELASAVLGIESEMIKHGETDTLKELGLDGNIGSYLVVLDRMKPALSF